MSQDQLNAIQARLSTIKYAWPDVSTRQGVDEAVTAGAIGAAYIGVAAVLGALMTLFSGVGFSAFLTAFLVSLLFVAISCALAWFIWKQQNFIAACIAAAWVAYLLLMSLIGLSILLIPAAIAMLLTVNGVRGTLALKQAGAR